MLIYDRCENVLPFKAPASFDGIFTDPPYNISQKGIGNLKGRKDLELDFGKWDVDFSPEWLIAQSGRLLVEGGWFSAFTSDHLFPQYYNALKENGFTYLTTVIWCKNNPPTQFRKKTFRSSVEYIVLAYKGDKPIYWNFTEQSEMKNYFMHPICSGNERLYWHVIEEEVIPCVNTCQYCEFYPSSHHPAQKPLFVWSWLYKRLCEEGMRILDPFSGTSSSGVAAKGLEWTGIEANPIYYEVGKKWMNGGWIAFNPSIEQESLDI